MARIASLYSGSSGNCTLVEDSGGLYLVDLGGSAKKAVEGIRALGLDPCDVRAVFITHEHIDHIAGLPVFLKHFNVPVFAQAPTAQFLIEKTPLPASAVIEPADAPFCIGASEVSAFFTPHDSLSCCGYRFNFDDGTSAAIATDIGMVSAATLEAMRGCRLVCLESNYDEGMLRLGRYPQILKQRILSDLGHLSNLDCAMNSAALAKTGTRRVMLMHISKENNTPDIAATTTLSELEMCGAEGDCEVIAAPRYTGTRLYEV